MTVVWLTSADVAAELGVSEASVTRAIRRGDLPAFSYGGLRRIRREDLDEFITAHMTTSPTTHRRGGGRRSA